MSLNTILHSDVRCADQLLSENSIVLFGSLMKSRSVWEEEGRVKVHEGVRGFSTSQSLVGIIFHADMKEIAYGEC